MNKYFRQKFSVKHPIPALFFNAYPDEEDPEDMKGNVEEIRKLWEYTNNFQPFPLEDIEVYPKCISAYLGLVF